MLIKVFGTWVNPEMIVCLTPADGRTIVQTASYNYVIEQHVDRVAVEINEQIGKTKLP